jgi:hypothetical protein
LTLDVRPAIEHGLTALTMRGPLVRGIMER